MKMKELKQLRESSSTDTDDSSVEGDSTKAVVKPRRRYTKSKRPRRHSAFDNVTNEVGALHHEIAKLMCAQDQMEKYQVNLERDHRRLRRQLLAVDCSKHMAEMKNRELTQEIRDIVEDQLRFGNRTSIRHGAKSIDKMEQYYTAEIGLLQIENRILQQKLERCEQSFLENDQQRHLSMLAEMPPQA